MGSPSLLETIHVAQAPTLTEKEDNLDFEEAKLFDGIKHSQYRVKLLHDDKIPETM